MTTLLTAICVCSSISVWMNNCDKLEPQDADKKQLEDFMDKFADNLDESMYNKCACIQNDGLYVRHVMIARACAMFD